MGEGCRRDVLQPARRMPAAGTCHVHVHTMHSLPACQNHAARNQLVTASAAGPHQQYVQKSSTPTGPTKYPAALNQLVPTQCMRPAAGPHQQYVQKSSTVTLPRSSRDMRSGGAFSQSAPAGNSGTAVPPPRFSRSAEGTGFRFSRWVGRWVGG